MPNNFTSSQLATQATLAHDLLGRDEELRELATKMLKLALMETINQLLRGDPATKAQIARAYAAPITKALTESDTEDGDQSLRAEMHQMFAEMRGEMDESTVESTVADTSPARAIVAKS